ncbi:MAG: Gx transporter family protein [Clostridia bacterium]|nr:Gx transporter family protein [Clostridia bacterium]
MNKKSNVKRLTFLGLCATVALLLSYVEFLLPPLFVAVPGIKLGLPNLIIIFLLYRLGWRAAVTVSMIRLLISSILFGSAMTFAYSLAGAVLSLLVMGLLKKTDLFSMTVVSIAGGVSHNLGQILVAMLLLNTPQIVYYMIVLAVTGTISGCFIGLCGALLVKRVSIDRFN